MPITRGSTPATALATTRARGARPIRSSAARLPTNSAAAPSLIPAALPAVVTPPLLSARRPPSFSAVVPGRGPSSLETRASGALLGTRDHHLENLVVVEAGLHGLGIQALGARGEGVGGFPVDAILGGQVVRRLGHGVAAVHLRDARIGEARAHRRIADIEPPAEGFFGLGHHEGRPAHALHASGHDDAAVAGMHGVGTGHQRAQTAAAIALDGGAGRADGETGQQRGVARHATAVLTSLVGTAHQHVVQHGRVEAGTLRQRAQGLSHQIVGTDVGQGSATLAEGRPDSVVDVTV